MKCAQHGAKLGTLPLLCSGLVAAPALEPDTASRVFHLFQPVPAEQLRSLSADRPDLTESPYTVDAGHLQIELDLVSVEMDRQRAGSRDLHSETWAISPFNLKLGVLHHVDLQFVLEPHVSNRTEDPNQGGAVTRAGFGDFQSRLKINLWGNDGGRTALAVMPFIKWPLPESDVRNGRTEGGIIFPLGIDLDGTWSLGLQTEFDFVADEAGGYTVEYFNSAALGRDLTDCFGGYVEFAALVSPEDPANWQGLVGLGFTYSLKANLQLDAGCNFGVTASAPDFRPFIGLSFRR